MHNANQYTWQHSSSMPGGRAQPRSMALESASFPALTIAPPAAIVQNEASPYLLAGVTEAPAAVSAFGMQRETEQDVDPSQVRLTICSAFSSSSSAAVAACATATAAAQNTAATGEHGTSMNQGHQLTATTTVKEGQPLELHQAAPVASKAPSYSLQQQISCKRLQHENSMQLAQDAKRQRTPGIQSNHSSSCSGRQPAGVHGMATDTDAGLRPGAEEATGYKVRTSVRWL